MPGRELVTADDVRSLAPGSQLVLGAGRIATPGALDLAHSRGVRVSWRHETGARPAAAAPASELWQKMKSADGTYVVQVRGGRARVTRIDGAGPQPLGEE